MDKAVSYKGLVRCCFCLSVIKEHNQSVKILFSIPIDTLIKLEQLTFQTKNFRQFF